MYTSASVHRRLTARQQWMYGALFRPTVGARIPLKEIERFKDQGNLDTEMPCKEDNSKAQKKHRGIHPTDRSLLLHYQITNVTVCSQRSVVKLQ